MVVVYVRYSNNPTAQQLASVGAGEGSLGSVAVNPPGGALFSCRTKAPDLLTYYFHATDVYGKVVWQRVYSQAELESLRFRIVLSPAIGADSLSTNPNP